MTQETKTDLVDMNDPILREEMPEFDFDEPLATLKAQQLYETMKTGLQALGGLGLSANQVGIRERMFVFGDGSDPDNIACAFNPIIVSYIGDEIKMEEGCLSYPGLLLKIKRPSAIRVRYANFDGRIKTMQFEGVTARVFQHELDHLNGIRFTDRVNPLYRDSVRQKLKKIQRAKKRLDKTQKV